MRGGGAPLGESTADMQAAFELAEFFEESTVQEGQAITLRPEGIRWEISEAAKELLLKQWKSFRRSNMGLADVRDAMEVEDFLTPQEDLVPIWGLLPAPEPTVDAEEEEA